MWLVTLTVVQLLAGVGFVLGISLFFAHIPMTAALFVSTGVPVINLLTVGMILGPQLVADQKSNGSYEYLRSMPVSRSVAAAAWYTVCLIGGVPAMVVCSRRRAAALRPAPARFTDDRPGRPAHLVRRHDARLRPRARHRQPDGDEADHPAARLRRLRLRSRPLPPLPDAALARRCQLVAPVPPHGRRHAGRSHTGRSIRQ